MSRKRTLVRIATSSTIILIILIGFGEFGYVNSSEIIYSSKPKPKLLLPKQLQGPKDGNNGNLKTQTVYGFLDFRTTVGNTVMIFTPQTKKVENPVIVQATKKEIEPTQTVLVSAPSSSISVRGPKFIDFEENDKILESSEFDIKNSQEIYSESRIQSQIHTATPQIRSSVFVVTGVATVEGTPVVVTPSSSRGFTLKFSTSITQNQPKISVSVSEKVQKKSSPIIVKPEIKEENVEFFTQKSVSSSGDDPRFNLELLGQEEGIFFEETSTPVSSPPIKNSTHYVLPIKPASTEEKAEIYASPIPHSAAYSKESEIYVDFKEPESTTRKAFRPTNRQNEPKKFTTRNKVIVSSTESNELLLSSPDTYSDERRISTGNNRFRTNRGRNNNNKPKPTPSQIFTQNSNFKTVNVYSSSPAAPSSSPHGRKFTSRGSRNGKINSEKHAYISPTSSTSIYRFKLSRPTGRWRFKPSPKPKVNIIKTKEEEEGTIGTNINYSELIEEDTKPNSNELNSDDDITELIPSTIRVSTISPTELSDFESNRWIEIATIKSPYVFQAGNVKNTRFITVTRTTTKESITPTQTIQPTFGTITPENILHTVPPYERILEGTKNIATLPIIILPSDTATPPLETITQTFSTTQLMLKTSILPVLYDGVTTLYTLTQSYFVTRIVTAHKTLPPMELYHFLPTKSLTEFNTALQEAGSEHREELIGSESETNENDANYEHFIAPPDELRSVGSEFDLSSMDDKIEIPTTTSKPKIVVEKKKELIPELNGLSPEQLAFLSYLKGGNGMHHQFYPQPPHLPLPQQLVPTQQFQPSPIIINTLTTIIETKTLRIQFGSKPTQTTIYSTRIQPTRITSYITQNNPQPTNIIPNYYPIPYLG